MGEIVPFFTARDAFWFHLGSFYCRLLDVLMGKQDIGTVRVDYKSLLERGEKYAAWLNTSFTALAREHNIEMVAYRLEDCYLYALARDRRLLEAGERLLDGDTEVKEMNFEKDDDETVFPVFESLEERTKFYSDLLKQAYDLASPYWPEEKEKSGPEG